MKKIISLFLAVCIALPSFSQAKGKSIPDLKGYVTLKCDFHIHTVFSDGLVWPTIRIDEAHRDGLDAIAITDHVEYRPYKSDIVASHNRSYEAALAAAEAKGIILIRGAEITRGMPPGHLNAIFLTDVDELDKPDYMDALRAAKAQNAFIFWNHPGWEAQQPDTTVWFDEHAILLEQGMLHGIEVVNEVCKLYTPEAHRWCLEKKLTMLGNTDVHHFFVPGKKRAMTLVFARSRTPEAIYEALMDRRTVVYYEDFIIGEEKYLKELFENALEWKVDKTENGVRVRVRNNSDLTFRLKKDSSDARLIYFRNTSIMPQVIAPKGEFSFTVNMRGGIKSGDVNFIVENFLVQPNEGMKYTLKISN